LTKVFSQRKVTKTQKEKQFMGVPETIRQLVKAFDSNLESYKNGSYNETQLRQEFLNPFFKALGWDITNERAYAPAYREVIHEDAIKVGSATKAPDYSFRIGGTRKFFVEAKKPSVDIKNDIHPAYQLRRYAWSAKLPLSILTDFEEFAVYDCRIRPNVNDKPSTARILFFNYKDYADKWDQIADIFSRDAILKGSFDKYAVTTKGKRGTTTVDKEFLSEIESWREMLAKNIALRNDSLTNRQLNYSVQLTIDRILFLRMCEDNGIEPEKQLSNLTDNAKIYKKLYQVFQRADEKYNSGLFHFMSEKGRSEPPDDLTPNLDIDDKPLVQIIKSLYYPHSPYVFSVMPAEILGNVYEQFLGKVIRLTESHQAKVEEKPEVKKAGGVYYTPEYIVKYIVKNTVGKLCENKTPKQISKLKILDPACGSGSFLLGAYTYLLDYHRDWYVENDPAKYTKQIYQGKGGQWFLTIAEKKRILLSNIYGVDIDSQAVEVTKLSLLLKVLADETQETLGQTLKLFHERALPDLAENIKCGNSLIAPDFYQNQQLSLFGEEEKYKINAFDWQKEFVEIFKQGGFDVIIGNPPYVLLQDEFRDDRQLEYFRSKFISASHKIDTYHLFIEQIIRVSKSGGRCSMIIPANILTNNHLDKLRRLMLERSNIQQLLVIDGGVFQGISVDNAIFVISPGKPTSKDFEIAHAKIDTGQLCQTSISKVSPDRVLADEHVLFTGTSEKTYTNLWKRIAGKSWVLGEIADVNFGKQLRDRKKFVKDVISVSSVRAIPASHRPCYTGRDVNRYSLAWGNLACLNDEIARCGGCWEKSKHDGKNKLVTRQIGRYPDFAIDQIGWHCLNTMFMVNLHSTEPDPRYVLGILNSKFMHIFWLDHFYDQRRTFPKIKGTYLKQLPILRINFSIRSDKAKHDKMISFVEQILDLHKKLNAAKVPDEKTKFQRQIDTTDAQIDKLVYDLYDLTAKEIEIVEGRYQQK
jgi:type I restriction-modification system DNA methylase subunit